MKISYDLINITCTSSFSLRDVGMRAILAKLPAIMSNYVNIKVSFIIVTVVANSFGGGGR